ncbi:hypothetical protein BGZ58_005050 [Dissophora ornata]|nr:hypothetical protein BGZ58_005050 [Dissophora ornata]
MVTPSLSELQFRLKLTGSVADLLKKLKDLHAELKTLEQEAVDTSSLSSVTKQLIDPSIVNHKDKGVKIYAACCIADLLRIYAPDAPYTNNNLKVIFGLFVNELRHISTPTSPYFSMYYYLLESLSVVKSIVLITDLKNADELMVDLFRNIFDDIRPQQAKNVQICMSELLQHIIDEASQLPQDIVDIILAQFLHKQKYFSDIISTAGNGELSSKEMADFKTVHQLVIELNKSTPALLLNVIPQLEEELKLSDITIRTLATKSLGEMFAEKSSQLATQYESTWRAWLQRRNDKIPQVRIVWIESLVKLIKAHGNLAKELSEGLAEKLVDPDEKVRAVACKTIGEFDYEASLHHIQKNTLIQVGHRCRDKKALSSKKLDSEEFEKKLGAVIKILCDRLPDPVKSSLLLHKYAQVRDAALLQSISDCMDSRLSLKEIRKAGKEALSRIETISPSTLEVLTILIQRISLTLVNSEILSELIKNIGESEEYREVSGELLRSISLIFPAIFKDHLVEITSLLRDPEFAGASDSLQTLAEFAKQFPKSVPADAKAKETLQSFLETGSIEQARHATIVLASIPNNENMCKSIAESINKRLLINSARLLWDLTILSQLALYAPQAFETISSSTISFIIKKLLMTNTLEQETVYEPDVDWVEKSELDEYSLSKVMGLKVLVNRAIVLLESDPDSAQDAVRPVFKLLWTIINQDGELADEKNTNAVLKSHLRLNAARLAIKLTRNRPVYEKMVSVAEYNRLALVIQDPVFRVRHGFASRIMKYLRSKELHIRYLAVLILTAHEPEAEWRLQVRSFLIQQSRAQNNVDNKLMLNELTLARAMHLLANHPDFIQRGPSEENMSPQQWATHSIDDLNLAVRYIEFYMDTMANSENVSLIYYIASLLKTVRFANPGEPTQNLYVASDLAQYVIQERSRSHNWTLTSYPGQVKLPRELFVPLDEDKLSVSTKSYLPSEWVHTREHKAERKPKVIVDRKIGQAAKRRSRSPSSPVEDDDVEDEKNISSSSRVKRAKKSKVTERVQEEPTRRMASRAAKVKTAVYKDAETSEEEADELESGEDSS